MAFAGEQTPVTEKNVYNRSEFWPFEVSIVGEEDDQPTSKSFHGILLRIEKDGMAIVDFGRDGRKHVSVENTDIIENANKILEGQLIKDGPNFIRQTTNMFATRKIGQKQMESIDPKTLVNQYEKILIIYCDESFVTEEIWESYKTLLNDFACTIPLIIPTKIAFYKGLADHSEWNGVHIMLPHLSIVHSEVLEHYPVLEPGGLTFVLIDLEGKIYGQWYSYGTETHLKTFEEVISELKKFENCFLLQK